jgi:cell division protein FtsB
MKKLTLKNGRLTFGKETIDYNPTALLSHQAIKYLMTKNKKLEKQNKLLQSRVQELIEEKAGADL